MAKATPVLKKPTKPIPISRASVWEKFKRQVDATAKELGVPQAFELKKLREKGKPRGDAWKDFERATAEAFRAGGFLKAERISRGDDLGESDVDVDVPEAPVIKVDCKYQVDGWSILTLFEEVEAKYVAPTSAEFLVLPLKAGGKSGSISVIRTEKLIELLAQTFLRDQGKGHALSCPLCPGALFVSHCAIDMYVCECGLCGTQVLLPQAKVPKTLVDKQRNAA